jgi:hypothetical protein
MKDIADKYTEDIWMGIDLAAKPDETIYYIDDGPFDRNKDSSEIENKLIEWLWNSDNKCFEMYVTGGTYYSCNSINWTKVEGDK